MPSYLITGASRGIGLEYVRQLSANKDNTVLALVRNKDKADSLKAILSSNIHVLEADITNPAALKKAASDASAVTGGSLDVLINNAAIVPAERIELNLDGYGDDNAQLAKDLRSNFETNVVGVIYATNAFLPLLKKGTVKKVVTLSTGVADTDLVVMAGWSTHAPYSISKAAVNMVNAKYAAEYKKDGFTFLALSPGIVNTAIAPPTPSEMAVYGPMMETIKAMIPDFPGPVPPEESVRDQLKVIDGVSAKDTGAFLSHHGNKNWI